MPETAEGVTSVRELTIVRLLQNPLGQEAPAGQRGDLVRVSDGRARIYLLPGEFDGASPATLRWLLAKAPGGDGTRELPSISPA
jgi:hypothetical protein